MFSSYVTPSVGLHDTTLRVSSNTMFGWRRNIRTKFRLSIRIDKSTWFVVLLSSSVLHSSEMEGHGNQNYDYLSYLILYIPIPRNFNAHHKSFSVCWTLSYHIHLMYLTQNSCVIYFGTSRLRAFPWDLPVSSTTVEIAYRVVPGIGSIWVCTSYPIPNIHWIFPFTSLSNLQHLAS